MSMRGIIFLLILYIAFAWVTVALVYQPDPTAVMVQKGLLWTAIGIGAVILWLLIKQIVGFFLIRRAQRKANPAQPGPALKRVHEDDGAFAALLTEADEKLAHAPDVPSRRVRDYPVFLVVGPDGSGKTSLLNNAGIDARHLAGHVLGGGASVAGTRVANVWLVGECIFIEIGGRTFQSDAVRFQEFLSVLRPSERAAGWRGFWNPPEAALQLRGVILCWDLRGFVSSQDRMMIERSSQTVRERLSKIAEVFGVRCPVYAVFTRTDSIPFFADFFGRLPETEAGQPLGVLLAPTDGNGKVHEGVWAEAETRRLTRDFNTVFGCLSARRLIALSQEPLAERKPGIYEFPREFKRLRTPVVQFLVDSLRPDPLSLSPILRGFFFCGSRQVAATADNSSTATSGGYTAGRSAADATGIFRSDMTSAISIQQEGGSRGSLIDKAVFSTDFFQVILRNDRPSIQAEAVRDPASIRQRRIILGAAAALAAILSLTWTWSWIGNRALVEQVESNVAASGKRIQSLNRESLEALDNLRRLLAQRLDQPRPLSMNWGLYTGDRLREGVHSAYFSRLRQVLLSEVNGYLIGDLAKLDHTAYPVSYETASRRLQTQITIAQSGCAVDPPLVSDTLKKAALVLHPDLDEPRKELLNRQIDYYVAALSQGNPVQLPSDPAAVESARKYLRDSHGPQQIYSAIVAAVQKDGARVLVRDRVGDFRQAMAAPEIVAFEFTKEGREKFEQLADSGKFNLSGEACVLGGAGQAGQAVASVGQIRQAKSIYYGRYKEEWEKFLSQIRVLEYRDVADAVAKLNILSSSTSPMLALIKFVGENTYFPAPKAPVDSGIVGKATEVFRGVKRTAEAALAEAPGTKPALTTAELNRVFQPAHVTVQPDGQNLVTPANKGYVEGLRKVLDGLDKYRNASTAERLTLYPQVEDAFSAAGSAQRALADTFNQDTEGVNERVAEILLQPIRSAKRVLPPRPDPWAERNAKLIQMCGAVAPMLRKYPFNRRSDAAELSLTDLSLAFAPVTGLIWKYQAQSMADLLVKNGNRWEQKPDAPKVTAELLEFLNRAQALSSAFFPAGATSPRLSYSLRPIPQQAAKLMLEIDGRTMNSKESVFQKDFEWPATSGKAGAEGKVLGDLTFGFGLYPGTWGVFRLFEHADHRSLGEKFVTWSQTSGIGAQPQPITPVKVEFVQFPGGADVFNPAFFSNFQCRGPAVVP